MSTEIEQRDIAVRPFEWGDVRALYELMARVGAAPFAFADDPMAAFERSLRAPRLDATRDVFVADAGGVLQGWSRLDLEPGISRGVVTVAAESGARAVTLRPRLYRIAHRRALETGISVLHAPIDSADDMNRMAASSIGMRPARTYHIMEYNPAPAYLKGDYRPAPDGFRVRPMREDEAARLTNIQNAAFEGMWGFAPNTVEEVEASLALPGSGPEGVLFVEDGDGSLAGYAWTRFEPSEGMSVGLVGMVGVHPDYRRRGLGGMITSAAIRLLREAGAGVVKLEVDGENRAARRLYRDLGFRKVSETVWHELRLREY